MSPRSASLSDTDIRRQILDAAEARFRQFGYRKTTMSEIADDCRMSAANLYRYFENKLDLASACASRCLGERVDLLRSVVRAGPGNVTESLRRFVTTSLEYTHEQVCDHPRVAELVAEVSAERQELVHQKLAEEQALLAELIARGNHSGEFDVADVLRAARAVQTAIVLFEVPIFVGLFTREEFERRADEVVDLLLDGLRKR